MSNENTAVMTAPVQPGSFLAEAAELEFQASLQLLADRACWVSGAMGGAIALKEEGVFRYQAVSGSCEAEPGAVAPTEVAVVRECLAAGVVQRGSAEEPATFALAAPIVSNGAVAGFIELKSRQGFTDEDAESVLRIADLVSVTVEHRDAALRAEKFEFKEEELDLPSLWHVPESAAQEIKKLPVKVEVAAETNAKAVVAEVKTCGACGFPVSPGRLLCVECERKPEAAAVPNLFRTEAEESWLSAHGYTIASILVSAITIAIIVWLRH
jgi:hypothetical protein